MADGQGSGIRDPGSGKLDIVLLGRGQYRIVDGSRQRIAYAAGPPEARWVFLEGRVYVVDTVRLPSTTLRPGKPDTTYVASGFPGLSVVEGSRTDTPARTRHDDELALAAPMPATVAAIHVSPGQEVETGDLLVMLEAMKMELPIRAPRAGRVKAIACRRGELVQPGVQLVELE
ncbi:MAG: biotin/lipoyl-binding protein [Acidobacteria bacterium]|nr:biotin/lipoyl-binding protein [Acidobacteriota bacterium]